MKDEDADTIPRLGKGEPEPSIRLPNGRLSETQPVVQQTRSIISYPYKYRHRCSRIICSANQSMGITHPKHHTNTIRSSLVCHQASYISPRRLRNQLFNSVSRLTHR